MIAAFHIDPRQIKLARGDTSENGLPCTCRGTVGRVVLVLYSEGELVEWIGIDLPVEGDEGGSFDS